jgi:hypothetical protein
MLPPVHVVERLGVAWPVPDARRMPSVLPSGEYTQRSEGRWQPSIYSVALLLIRETGLNHGGLIRLINSVLFENDIFKRPKTVVQKQPPV